MPKWMTLNESKKKGNAFFSFSIKSLRRMLLPHIFPKFEQLIKLILLQRGLNLELEEAAA